MRFKQAGVWLPWLFLTMLFCPMAQGADFSAPLVVLPLDKPVEDPDVYRITAKVTDDGMVESVTLYYRPLGSEAEYQRLRMSSERTGEQYSATILLDPSFASGIEYYVEARDRASNISQEPFPDQPRKIRFADAVHSSESLAGGAGKKWLWIGLGVLVTGALLAASNEGGGGEGETTSLTIEAPLPGTE